jgi:hypothetical protein
MGPTNAAASGEPRAAPRPGRSYGAQLLFLVLRPRSVQRLGIQDNLALPVAAQLAARGVVVHVPPVPDHCAQHGGACAAGGGGAPRLQLRLPLPQMLLLRAGAAPLTATAAVPWSPNAPPLPPG